MYFKKHTSNRNTYHYQGASYQKPERHSTAVHLLAESWELKKWESCSNRLVSSSAASFMIISFGSTNLCEHH